MAQEYTPNTYEGSVRTKYLDWTGLSRFWDKAKQYISNEILALDATKIPMNLTQETRTTISSEFEKLWNAIGGDATNISGSISQILGAYVKSIKGKAGSYVTVGIEGVDIDKSTSGAVDVELTIDETNLDKKIKILDTINSDYINGVEFVERDFVGNEYVSITPVEDSAEHKILFRIDDSKIDELVNQDSQNYAVNGQKFQDADNNNVILISGDIPYKVEENLYVSTVYEEIEGIKKDQITDINDVTGSYIDITFNTVNNAVTPSINEQKLIDKFGGLENSVVKNIVGDEDNSYVNISFDNLTKGSVTATIDETKLAGKINDLQGAINRIDESDGEQDDKIDEIEKSIDEISQQNYVNTFAGQSGDILINTADATPGGVNFSISEDKVLKGVVVGLGSAAYEDFTPYTTEQIEGIFVVAKKLISFSVDGVEYSAEEGMTWREWLQSEYDLLDMVPDTDGGIFRHNEDLTFTRISNVHADDVIISSFNYTTITTGGSN